MNKKGPNIFDGYAGFDSKGGYHGKGGHGGDQVKILRDGSHTDPIRKANVGKQIVESLDSQKLRDLQTLQPDHNTQVVRGGTDMYTDTIRQRKLSQRNAIEVLSPYRTKN